MVASGQLPVFSPLVLSGAKSIIEWIFDAIINNITGKRSDTRAALDIIGELAANNNQIAKDLIARQAGSKQEASNGFNRWWRGWLLRDERPFVMPWIP
jgi:hypothetical protein